MTASPLALAMAGILIAQQDDVIARRVLVKRLPAVHRDGDKISRALLHMERRGIVLRSTDGEVIEITNRHALRVMLGGGAQWQTGQDGVPRVVTL